ncbi:MAG: 2-C-methyl-D-erythritol 4-phosphate cytidylyltransferase [Candidatus Omnitrophota bacterium]|jgi:2-C-methyl-D-erythritol 4-phosphate cytidylyltransferase
MAASVILLAAGRGKRFSSSTPKVLALIDGKPVFLYSLLVFLAHPRVSEVVLVAGKESFPGLRAALKKTRFCKPVKMVLGGKERQDSVSCGLKNVSAASGLVLIHDAARPFISRRLVDGVMRAASLYGAAVPGVPLKSTIKEISLSGGRGYGGSVVFTPERGCFCEVQTPQAFKRGLILSAYSRIPDGRVFTDDASLVEEMGKPVRVAAGEYTNIKITTREDLDYAAAIARRAKKGDKVGVSHRHRL